MPPFTFIIDANIIFSGILNTNGKIGDLLLNSVKEFQFLAPDFLRHELSKHYRKISSLSGLTVEEVREVEFYLTQHITFISQEQIEKSHLENAKQLVAEIDPKDYEYIAYASHFACKLWSGDGVLSRGLKKKGFREIISTQELYELRDSLRTKK